MKHSRLIAALILCLISTGSLLAQSPQVNLTKDGQRIQKRIVNYGFGHRITVTLKGGAKYRGTVGLLDENTFQINEVDLMRAVAVSYNDVQKVQDNYGERNIYGKRVNPRTSKIVLFGVLGVIAGFLLLAVPKT